MLFATGKNSFGKRGIEERFQLNLASLEGIEGVNSEVGHKEI